MSSCRKKETNKVTLLGLAGNATLAGLKFMAGVLGHSSAMIADAIHSLSDMGTDLFILLTLRIACRPKDKNHKYGHGKVETLATAFMGFVIAFVGFGVLVNALVNLVGHYNGQALPTPGWIAFWVALSSFAIKEFLYRYTLSVGRKFSSKVVQSNAWNHRSDALSSIAATLGIGGAIFLGPQWVILDPIAAIVVSFFILRVSALMVKDSLMELIETSLPKPFEKEILRLVGSVDGVHNPHDLKTRRVGNDIAIDLHIQVDRNLNVERAHEITVEIEKCLFDTYGQETHISIHTEPLIPEK